MLLQCGVHVLYRMQTNNGINVNSFLIATGIQYYE